MFTKKSNKNLIIINETLVWDVGTLKLEKVICNLTCTNCTNLVWMFARWLVVHVFSHTSTFNILRHMCMCGLGVQDFDQSWATGGRLCFRPYWHRLLGMLCNMRMPWMVFPSPYSRPSTQGIMVVLCVNNRIS